MNNTIETIITSIDPQYKKTKITTNECIEEYDVLFYINQDDGMISYVLYEDRWVAYGGFKTINTAIEACIKGLKKRAYEWAHDTHDVDYDSLQIGWRAFEPYKYGHEGGDIGEIVFTIAMNSFEEDFDDAEW